MNHLHRIKVMIPQCYIQTTTHHDKVMVHINITQDHV